MSCDAVHKLAVSGPIHCQSKQADTDFVCAAHLDFVSRFPISSNAIYNIKRRKHDFEAAAASCGDTSLDKKSLKTTKHRNLEEALLIWLRQKRNLRESVSGPLLSKKAMVLNEKLGENPGFKASHGWLSKFKYRHAYIDANNYDAANIYNADESGLNWRSLPTRKVLTLCEERLPPGRNGDDRVTVMFCANASGTHRLPVLVIGKQQLTLFQDAADLPTTYKARTSIWMDPSVFLDWYRNNFIPLVRNQQATEGRHGKVLLLHDDTPSHPPGNVLNAIDTNFKVKYMPPNVSELIQPMSQGVIETAKKLYRKNLTKDLVKNEFGIKEFMKNFILKNCCYLIAGSWNKVAFSTLARAWKAFIPFDEASIEERMENCDENVNALDLVNTLNLALGIHLHERELENWLTEDAKDNGWEIINDDEILASVTTRGETLTENANSYHAVFVKLESKTALVTTEEQVLPGNENHGNTVSVKVENVTKILDEVLDVKDHVLLDPSYSAQEALQALNVVYSWLDLQPECFMQDLAALNRIRDLALSKSTSK